MDDEPSSRGDTETDGQLKLTFTVSEGVPVGTFIGVIKSTNASVLLEPPFLIVPMPGGDWHSPATSVAKLPQPFLHTPPYTLDSQQSTFGTVDTDLNIDQSTGEIRTAVELDREQRSHYSFIAISLTGVNIHVKIVSPHTCDAMDNCHTIHPSEHIVTQ